MFVMLLALSILGFSKGLCGGGPGALATPIMLIALKDPRTSLGVMLPVMIMCDVLCVLIYGRKHHTWGKITTLAFGFGIGILVGGEILTKMSAAFLTAAIGILCIVFGSANLILHYSFQGKKRMKDYLPQGIWFGVTIGAIAGVTSTVSHGAGPIFTIFFISQGVEEKKTFMSSMVTFALIGNSMKAVMYGFRGVITPQTISISFSLPVILASVFGVILGWYLHRKMSEKGFKVLINIILFLIGVYLLVK